MKALIAAALLMTFSVPVMADTCVANADTKKLAGAARTSFLTKCQKDAQAACDAQAADKKIYGAAKTSFTKKCVNDTVGSSAN